MFKNFFPQVLQRYGFSPVWVLTWTVKSPLKPFPHVLHVNGLCVWPNVGQQVTTISEISSTRFATISLLTCVDSHVGCPVIIVSESSPTCFTSILLLTCVHSHVDLQGTATSEIFPTCFVQIWLLACVRSYVLFQLTTLYEIFPMFHTQMLLTCVDSQVCFKFWQTDKSFATFVTF